METAPLIITCAPIGAELTKEDTPYLPVTPDELAEAAVNAVEAGAAIVHLHVRDENGRASQRVDIFSEVTEKILARCDCIVQYSTGGAAGTPLGDRLAPLSLEPEMATLSMGTINFGAEVFENTETTIQAIATAMKSHHVFAELEIFDAGMLDSVARLRKQHWFPERYHVDFVLGVPGGLGGDLRNLMFLRDRLPRAATWSVAGIGKYQLPLTAHAIAMGGHVRVGFEDNIYFRKGELATSNACLVKRVVRMAAILDRAVASPAEARRIIGLPGRPG